jgi:hypothetical protein
MLAQSVYRLEHVRRNVWTVAALCSSWLESAQPLRNVPGNVRIKLDNHPVDVGIICKCVLPAKRPVLFQKFRTPSIPGTICMIRSLP